MVIICIIQLDILLIAVTSSSFTVASYANVKLQCTPTGINTSERRIFFSVQSSPSLPYDFDYNLDTADKPIVVNRRNGAADSTNLHRMQQMYKTQEKIASGIGLRALMCACVPHVHQPYMSDMCNMWKCPHNFPIIMFAVDLENASDLSWAIFIIVHPYCLIDWHAIELQIWGTFIL